MKKIILAILKCFMYIVIMGVCQAICSSIIPNDNLLSTLIADTMFVLLVLLLIKVAKQSVKERLKINKIAIKTIVIVIIISLALNLVFQSVQLLFPESMRSELMVEMDTDLKGVKSLIGFITVVIIAPFTEEILFRGLILGELAKCFNIHIAIILQAILFGIMHGNIIWAVIAFLSAMLYGYFIRKYGNIFTSTIGHMSVNLLSFILT